MATEKKVFRHRHHSQGFKSHIRPLLLHIMKNKICYKITDSFKFEAANMLEMWIDDACDYFRPMLGAKDHTTLTVKDAQMYFKSLDDKIHLPAMFPWDHTEERMSVTKRYGLHLPVSLVRNGMQKNLGPRYTLRTKPGHFAVAMTAGFQERMTRILTGFGAHHAKSKGVKHTAAHLNLFLKGGDRLAAFAPHTASTAIKCNEKKASGSKKGKKSPSKKASGSKKGGAKVGKRKSPAKKSASIKRAETKRNEDLVKLAEADAEKTVKAVKKIKQHEGRSSGRITNKVDRYGFVGQK